MPQDHHQPIPSSHIYINKTYNYHTHLSLIYPPKCLLLPCSWMMLIISWDGIKMNLLLAIINIHLDLNLRLTSRSFLIVIFLSFNRFFNISKRYPIDLSRVHPSSVWLHLFLNSVALRPFHCLQIFIKTKDLFLNMTFLYIHI